MQTHDGSHDIAPDGLIVTAERGQFQLCLQCGAISTGVTSPRGDGLFVMCGACRRRRDIEWGADTLAPRVKGYGTRARTEHREALPNFHVIQAAVLYADYHEAAYGYRPQATRIAGIAVLEAAA
jgi:hypothetical protein